MAEPSELQFGGARDTTRLSLDPAAEAERLRQARRARTNLASLLVDEAGGLEAVREAPQAVAAGFAELCDMLGLAPPVERAPGRCSVCKGPLSTSTMTNPTTAQRQGFCTVGCKRRANLRNQGGGS